MDLEQKNVKHQTFQMVGNDHGETKQQHTKQQNLCYNGQQQLQKLQNHWNEIQQMDAVEEYEKDKNQANEYI